MDDCWRCNVHKHVNVLLIIHLLIVAPSSFAAVLPAEAGNVPKTTPPPEVKVNCSRSTVKKNERIDGVQMLKLPATGHKLAHPAGPESNDADKYGPSDGKPPLNCTVTDTDSEVSVVYRRDVHHWKTKVIITCTIAAAVEIVIVMFIVMYWREIRWTMRKISCQCLRRRHHQSSNHQAMSEDHVSDDDMTQDDVIEDGDVTPQPGYSVRLYSPATDHHDNDRDNEIEELQDTTPV